MKSNFPSFRVITIICGVYSFQSKSNITQTEASQFCYSSKTGGFEEVPVHHGSAIY